MAMLVLIHTHTHNTSGKVLPNLNYSNFFALFVILRKARNGDCFLEFWRVVVLILNYDCQLK